jgi:thioredoxin reductase
MENPWDCIIVGAGAAGLSAALVLGRARQRTLVVDAGGQSNRVAHGIGGLLGHDRRPPAELYAAGRDELAAYPTVALRSGEVLGGEQHDAGFVLELADGSREVARRVLLATGMDYLFAAGDVSSQMPFVANAVAAGSNAAAMIVHGLMADAHSLTPVGDDSAG